MPVVERTVKQKCLTAPILQKIDQRRSPKGLKLYLWAAKSDKNARQQRKTCWAAQCDVKEQLDAAHKTNLMYSQIRLVTGRERGRNSTTCIEDKEGNIVMEKENILSRWYEYIGELYNDDRGDMLPK